MSGTTAALIGALIGAVTALASGVPAGYVALRSERMRHREASTAAHAGSVREHTAAFFAELFAVHFAASWVAWFAAHDPGALDHGMAEFYGTETYRAFRKLLGSTAMVAALNTGVCEQLKPLIIEACKLWERVMHGLHQLDHSPDEAIAELRGCLPDAMKPEFQLIPGACTHHGTGRSSSRPCLSPSHPRARTNWTSDRHTVRLLFQRVSERSSLPDIFWP